MIAEIGMFEFEEPEVGGELHVFRPSPRHAPPEIAPPVFLADVDAGWWLDADGCAVCAEHAAERMELGERLDPLSEAEAEALEEAEVGDLLVCRWCDGAAERHAEIIGELGRVALLEAEAAA